MRPATDSGRRAPPWPRAAFAVAVLTVVVAVAPRAGYAKRSYSEAEIKANFVERFTRFVDWPGEESKRRTRFVVCVAGETDTVAQLRAIVADQKIKGLPAEIRAVGVEDELADCAILLIAASAKAEAAALLSRARKYPILTIGDGGALADAGLMICFVRRGRMVRFMIDPDRAAAARIRMRAKLVRLGLRVATKRAAGDR